MHNREVVNYLTKEETIDGYGLVVVSPDKARARQWCEFTLAYQCEKAIAAGGSLRLTIPHFFSSPQMQDPALPGHVVLLPDMQVPATLDIDTNMSCPYHPKGFTGRFGKTVFMHLPEGLQPGQSAGIVFGNQARKGPGAQAPDFACTAYFLAAVDPFGDRRAKTTGYYLLQDQGGLTVSGRRARRMSIHLPSAATKGRGRATIAVTDNQGNLSPDFSGSVKLLCPTPGVEIPTMVSFSGTDGGRKTIEVNNPEASDFRIEVVSDELDGECNGSCRPAHDFQIFWGEYHVHSYSSDGLGTTAEAFNYGREHACLDWGATADHLGFEQRQWDLIRRDTAAADQPGEFVSFLGFEVTAHPSVCDFCIISPDMDLDLSEFINAPKDEIYHAPLITIEHFYQALQDRDVIIIPHFHLGRGAIWDFPAPSEMRLAEIYSCWGNHEYEGCAFASYGGQGGGGIPQNTIRALLDQGYRCGIVAGSDSHSGQMGKTTWLRTRGRYPGGLTAILADELTRESLWKALMARRTYATTGARIFMDFTVNSQPMGSEIKVKRGESINLHAKAAGTVSTFLTQIIRNGEFWKGFDVQTYPYPPEPGRDGIVERDFTDENLEESAWYYLRVTQTDGHMAWSSPVWVDVCE